MTSSLAHSSRFDRLGILTSYPEGAPSVASRWVRTGLVGLVGLSALTAWAADPTPSSPMSVKPETTMPANVASPAPVANATTAVSGNGAPTSAAPLATATPEATSSASRRAPEAQPAYATPGTPPAVSSASRPAPQGAPNGNGNGNGYGPLPTSSASRQPNANQGNWAPAQPQPQPARAVDSTASASRTPPATQYAQPAPVQGVNATSGATLMRPSTQVQTPPNATSGATPANPNSLPTLTLDEANQTRRLLERIGAPSPMATPHFEYAQPSNKKAACKILISQVTEGRTSDFIWDGDCKDGYAKGLGRLFWSMGPLRLNAIVNLDERINDRLFAVLMIHNEQTDTTELNMTSYPTKPWDPKDPDRMRYETLSTRTTVERYEGKTRDIYHSVSLLTEAFQLKTTLSQKSQTYLVREDLNGVSYSAWQALNAKKDGTKALEQLWYVASPSNPQTPLGVGMARLVDGSIMKIRFDEKGWSRVNVPDNYFEPFQRMAKTRTYMQQQTVDFNKRGANLLADYMSGICKKRVQPADTRSVSKADFFAICEMVPAFIEASKAITITDEEVAQREAEKKAKASDAKKK